MVEGETWGQRRVAICFLDKINSACLCAVGDDSVEQGKQCSKERGQSIAGVISWRR